MRSRRTSSHDHREPGLPGVNASVAIEGDGWPASALTRVEDLTADAIVVARPTRAATTLITAPLGAALRLSWTTEEARYALPVQLSTATEGHVPTWTLTPAGPVRREQRRESFRLDLALPGRIGTPSSTTAITQIHDLSEGGLRCTPPSGHAYTQGDEVWVELPLPEGPVRVDAVVVRVSSDGTIGLRFEPLPEVSAEQVRSYLFAEQLARRSRLASRRADE